MKKIFTILFLISVIGSKGQNLVPNGNFEDHYDCDNDAYQLDVNALNWRMIGSADYFNSCVNPHSSSVLVFDVPQNNFGYQSAYRDSAYAGISLFSYYNYREYIQAKLTAELDSNAHYCISFHVSLSDSSTWGINKIGAFVSSDSLNPVPYQPLSSYPWSTFTYYTPQIECGTMIGNINNWAEISGVYQAIGNENYITIGNFKDDLQTDTLRVLTRSSPDVFSYYYIDDVSIEKVLNAKAGDDAYFIVGDSVQLGNNPTENATYSWLPVSGLSNPNAPNPKAAPSATTSYVVTKTQCNAITKDTVLLYLSAVGVNENTSDKGMKLYPNPSNGTLVLECNLQSNESAKLLIYDLTGRIVGIYTLENNNTIINAEMLSSGMYQYEVIIDEKSAKRDKLIIIK